MDKIKSEISFLERKAWENSSRFFSNLIVGIILRITLVYFFNGILEYQNYDEEQAYVLRHIWNAAMYLIPMVFFAIALRGLIVAIIASVDIYFLKRKIKRKNLINHEVSN